MYLFIYVLSVAVLATRADVSGCLRLSMGSKDFPVLLFSDRLLTLTLENSYCS